MDIEELIERQRRRWEVEPRASVPRPGGAPCIALSHQPGSSGDEIARQAAEWLDYGFFDAATLERIAADASLRERLLGDPDPASRAAIERDVAEALRSRTLSEDESLRALVGLVCALARRGMVVLEGDLPARVLSADQGLRVLVVAPRSERVERRAVRTGLAIAEASAEIEDADRRRDAFHRLHLGAEADDVAFHDLVVNAARFPRDSAARVIVEALRRRFPVRA